ncbi:MAG TPA: SAM-dependent methyltransferase [Myxococcota bacterium]|nr:SAM-dependent methyltransferase [Myxococcota bacterium]
MAGKHPVGRGGLKLAATLERFRLAERVREARAIDVGASTGGFTECLLAAGARSVMAIDVGHGQLHPRLREDARVSHLEGTDFKTLSLGTAAGPFDFFTVDVSFVAARSMLRSLAFRLVPGAEGVVLIKPQFELPDKQVRRGDVSDPAVRGEAVRRFTRKATALGFEVAATLDSPVPGGSGTVEIVAHLRFRGRTAALPQPGERRARALALGPPSPSSAPGFAERTLRWFAAAAPGVEPVLLREVESLPGMSDMRAVEGGVEFSGTLEAGMRANLWLRTASRVLLRVGRVEARDFARLRRRVSTLPWRELVPDGAALHVKASAKRSRLFHTGAVEETVRFALADSLSRNARTLADPQCDSVTVLARGEDDRWTLSIDSSGELLHRRGWRLETAQAPLRETLAAALILLCEWDPATPLVDPMCGAGTLPIEAAAIALQHAPGLGRSFAFERWPCIESGAWERERAAAKAVLRGELTAPILGFDRSPSAVESARRNAERAGVAHHLRLEELALAELRAPRFRRPRGQTDVLHTGARPPRGLVLANPPYGRRLVDVQRARAAYTELGRVLRERFRGWQVGILSAHPAHSACLRLGQPVVHSLRNGGIRVELLRFTL